MFSPRGLHVVKVLRKYAAKNTKFFDTSSMLDKFTFTSLNDEQLLANFQVETCMCNGGNVIHGGFVASIIDVACVYANLGKTNGKFGLTTNLYVNYIKSAQCGDKIFVDVKTLKNGAAPILEAYLRKEDGSIMAKGTTCFVIGNEQFQKHCADTFELDS